MKTRYLLLACALAIPGVAMSAQCDADLAKVKAAIAAGPNDKTVSPQDFDAAKQIAADAEALNTAKDDTGCMDRVKQAMELLHLAK